MWKTLEVFWDSCGGMAEEEEEEEAREEELDKLWSFQEAAATWLLR